MSVSCVSVAQEHNEMVLQGPEPGPLNPRLELKLHRSRSLLLLEDQGLAVFTLSCVPCQRSSLVGLETSFINSLPVLDECERFVVILVGAWGSPALVRDQHQLGVIRHDFHLQVHFLIKVLIHGVTVIWIFILIRRVHIHRECKVTKLSCKFKIK